jgi:hypothetical protein
MIYDLQVHLGQTSVKTTEIYLAYLEEARHAKPGSAQNPAHLGVFSGELLTDSPNKVLISDGYRGVPEGRLTANISI